MRRSSMHHPLPGIASPALLLFLFLAVFGAHARIVKLWTDEELKAKSEFIVIAIPQKTRPTDERGVHPELKNQPVIGLSTEFTVVAVYKGHQAMKSFVLHHYRPDRIAVPNAPAFLTFDPAGKQKYRLYLVKEPDGRWAPVTGQTNPDMSVRKESEK